MICYHRLLTYNDNYLTVNQQKVNYTQHDHKYEQNNNNNDSYNYSKSCTKIQTKKNPKLTSWCSELQGTETDIIESLIIQDHAFISIFNKLVHRKRGIVRLHNCVGHLRRRKNRKRQHHAIRVLFPNLGDEKRSHAGAGTTTQRVAQLKPCQSQQPNTKVPHR